jgi:3-hydroxy-9,10-secoandrosta-1,3,5(10)-triene-9,17-dione monooxygenase reductase component
VNDPSSRARPDREETDVLLPDAASFRAVLGHFATGITVITAMDDGEPVGIAANSFTSVSLEPPLVLFCAAKSSSTWPRIRNAGHFMVNVLHEHQEEISRLFAQKGVDRFSRIGWRAGDRGPILDDVHAYLDCTIEAVHDAGDHEIVVGRVHQLGLDAKAGPLLFYQGRYGRLLGSE